MASRTQQVVRVLNSLIPLKLAGSWDNVGLLVEAPAAAAAAGAFRVLVTNDITPAVLQEAVAKEVTLLFSYHPTPFAAMKVLTSTGPFAAQVVLTAAKHDISIYSPHTALDAMPDGLNDWLITAPLAILSSSPITLQPITPDPVVVGAGLGRIGTFAPVSLAALIDAVKRSLGIERLQVALPASYAAATAKGAAAVAEAAASINVSSMAVCAGSGGGILKPSLPADVLLTGELSHHEVLAAAAAGKTVICTQHSRCERPYLRVFAEKMRTAFAADAEMASSVGSRSGSGGGGVEVLVSAVDADPLVIM